MAPPIENKPPAELQEMLDKARRDMQQRQEDNMAAVAEAFRKINFGGVNDCRDDVEDTVIAGIMSNTSSIIDPRLSQPSHSAPPQVPQIYTSSNGQQYFQYQRRDHQEVKTLSTTPQPISVSTRSTPVTPTMTPSTPTKYSTMPHYERRSSTDLESPNLTSPSDYDSTETTPDGDSGKFKRTFEMMEPDPADLDNLLRWESWALRKAIRILDGCDHWEIEEWLEQEHARALGRRGRGSAEILKRTKDEVITQDRLKPPGFESWAEYRAAHGGDRTEVSFQAAIDAQVYGQPTAQQGGQYRGNEAPPAVSVQAMDSGAQYGLHDTSFDGYHYLGVGGQYGAYRSYGRGALRGRSAGPRRIASFRYRGRGRYVF